MGISTVGVLLGVEMNNGLLAQIYSFGNTTRNKLRGLLDDPVGTLQQAADAAASGLNNLTGKQEVEQQFALRDRIKAGDKNALAEYKRLGDKFNEKMLNLALDSNPAAVGMTAWHGSPHKFDKFDLSKIGTGEGAQAYGHGVYLAEAPEVAKGYQASTTNGFGLPNGQNVQGVANVIAMRGEGAARKMYADLGKDLEPTIAKAKEAIDKHSSLYKTDIPDEAVARFLDWDKPLSQQSIGLPYNKEFGAYEVLGRMIPETHTGALAYQSLTNGMEKDFAGAAKRLFDAGIPGIRYLDGGSRAAGQGSSNFVVFDPNMIRILERNGQATGAQPWKPGEWGGLLK